MTIFMPTLLLNIIGHSTTLYDSAYFDAMVAINLTVSMDTFNYILSSISMKYNQLVQVMLVLTTMFVSVNQSLPPTSYMKMVDYWLVFTLFIPFVETLLQTYKVFQKSKFSISQCF